MNDNILVLCDTEEEYARLMSEYLKSHREIAWDIRTYTDVSLLMEFAGEETIKLLVVADNAYTEEVRRLPAGRTVLLNESGVMRWNQVRNINKYQKAEDVYKEIVNEFMDVAQTMLPRLAAGSNTRLIGMFSPVKRCLQTSFALTFGQMLAEKFRVLYLNFEHCAGNRELLPDTQTRDLTDLIFFLNTDKERFLLRMQTILQKKGKMDYIPPVRAGMQLLEVTPEEWLEMLRRIGESEEYDYVILDLSENIQGLLQLLRLCTRIFTLTKDDRAARGKVAQYEQVLALYEYEDILQKTSMYKLPRFRKLPESVEQMTRGELADYVRRIMEEMLSEGTGTMEEGAAGKGFIKGGLWQGDDGRRDTGYY